MKKINTQAIVLSRTDFGEADRIITFLTLDHGKLRGLARGVRKQKSKLAGGIELFSVSDISFIVGRGEIYTIASTRLIEHFGKIVKDLERTNTAYEFIKLINKITEDNVEPAYFELLKEAFSALDSPDIELDLISIWFKAQLLRLGGHIPNLVTDQDGHKLASDKKYTFDFDAMNFKPGVSVRNSFSANHIKFLRLVFGDSTPKTLQKVQGSESLTASCAPLIQNLQSLD